MSSDYVNPEAKTCWRCGETKSLDAFYRRRKSKDGRAEQCKECAKAAARAWQRANPERAAESKRRWVKENRAKLTSVERHRRRQNPERAREYSRRYRERNPLKVEARHALGRALREKRVVKPKACEACHTEVTPRDLQAHHDDYSKPLKVEWLCRWCHWADHKTEATNAL
jgi:hypothetical protein